MNKEDNKYDEFGFFNPFSVKDEEKSDDCISRQAVLDLPRIKTHNHWGNVIKESVDIEDVRQLPPVTPVEKVGRWERVQYDSNPNIGNWHCSECRAIIPHMPENTDNTPIYKWCPMCGAKMQEGDAE